MDVLIAVAVMGVLIFLNGIFVAAEFAIIAVPPTRVAQMAEAGSRAAQRVLQVLRSPEQQNRYLATAQIGITIVSLGLGMYGEQVLAAWLLHPLEQFTELAAPLAHTIAGAIAVAFLTYLHVVLGEMVAKSYALQYPEPTALRLIGPMHLLQRIFSPVILALNGLANGITRLLGVPPPDRSSRLFSPQELEFIVEESFEQGLLEPSEQLFIENIFDLRERTVGQVMTPRVRVVGIPVGTDEEQVLETVCTARHTRYPVYREDLDHIIGVLHIKDLARYRIEKARDPEHPFDLEQLATIRQIVFVPETLPVEVMLARFRAGRFSLAVVIDEFGGTAGIVTLEDLVEEVVGEIQDEFDLEQPPIQELEPGVLRVQGDLLLDELNQHYDLALEHPEVDTVSGLIMALLGRIPEPGDQVTYRGVTFQVESVEGRAVGSALVILPRPEESSPDGLAGPQAEQEADPSTDQRADPARTEQPNSEDRQDDRMAG